MQDQKEILGDHDILWRGFYDKIDAVSEESLRLILNEGDKFLVATVEIAESFKTRASTGLTFLIPSALALLLLIINEDNSKWDFGDSGLLCAAMLLTLASYYFLIVINVKSSLFPGYSPDKILCENWITGGDNQIKNLLFNQCEEVQKKIHSRISQNIDIADKYERAVMLMFVTPAITAFFFFLSFILTFFY